MRKFIMGMIFIGIFGVLAMGCIDKEKTLDVMEERCKLCEEKSRSVLDEGEGKEKGYCDKCWKIKDKLEQKMDLKKDDPDEKKAKEKKLSKEKVKEDMKEPRCKDCGGKFLKNKAGQEALGICFNCQGHYCYLCNQHISESAFNETCEKCEPTIYCKQCGKGTKNKEDMCTDINGDNICVACVQPRNGKCVGCSKVATIMNGICEQCHERIMEENM